MRACWGLLVVAAFSGLEARDVPWYDVEPRPLGDLPWYMHGVSRFDIIEIDGALEGFVGLGGNEITTWTRTDAGPYTLTRGRLPSTREVIVGFNVFSSRARARSSLRIRCSDSITRESRRSVSFGFDGFSVYKEETDCVFSPPDLDEIVSISIGDLDGDGLDDAVGQFDDGRLVWWEQPDVQESGENWPQLLIDRDHERGTVEGIADIDRDGDNDILHFHQDEDTGRTVLRWLENTTTGGYRIFRSRLIEEVASRPGFPQLIDFDRDGDLDLVARQAQSDDSIKVNWWENASPDARDWVNRGAVVISASEGAALRFGDIDRDGDLDMLVDSAWCENRGGPAPYTWTHHGLPLPGDQVVTNGHLTDYDHDGDLDILYAYELYTLTYEARVLENILPRDTMLFPEKRVIASGFDQGNDVAIGDLDRDGDLDVVAAAWWDDAVRVWENNGAAVPDWTMDSIDEDVDGAQSIVIADIDRDGWPDLVGGASGLDSVLWWSNQGGDWNRDVIETANASRTVAVIDYDGDADLDVAVAVTADDAVSLWITDDSPRTGDWPSEDIMPGGSLDGVWDVVSGDLDGDGDADLVASAETAGEIKWYENMIIGGERVMWPHDLKSGLDGIRGIDLADLDGDRDLDVVGAVSGLNLIVWWENAGGDPIDWVTHFIGSGFEGAIDAVAHDVDGDNDLDVVGAAETAGAITWWENTVGDGIHWKAHPVTTEFSEVRALALADLDRNGAVDIVAIAGRSKNEVAWWPNQPRPWSGTITASPQRILVPGVGTEVYTAEITNSGGASEPALVADNWELRIERAENVPVTQAILDEMVASISVYEDDGDGRFGPEDTLVFEESSLTVDAEGVVTVGPPSVDPPLVIEPGETGRFILVLTPAEGAHESPFGDLLLTPVHDRLVHPDGAETPVPLADSLLGSGLFMKVVESGTDLTGGDFVAPAEMVTQKTYEVSWRTVNPSEREFGWSDRLVLSRDPIYQKEQVYEPGSDDIILGTYGWITPAAAVDYTAHDHIQIPRVAPGVYTLIVSLDETETLDDMDLGNNQLPLTVRILAPDLVPSDLTAPEVWETQQEVTIEWTVENRGDGESGRWNDSVWLFPAMSSEDDRIRLGEVYDTVSLPVGESVTLSLTVEVPGLPQGHYVLMVECNDREWVHEHSTFDQTLYLPVTLIGPDLVATAFTAPSAVVSGTEIEYEWAVINQGAADGGLSEDAVYFSTDPVRSSGDELLSWEIAPALESLASYDFWDTRVALPVSEPGRYYLLLAVDYARGVYEFNEDNNLVVHPIEIVDPSEPRPMSSIERVPGPAGSRFRLAVSSALGQSFRIEASPDLSPASWTPVTFYSSSESEIGLAELAGTGFEIPVFVAIDDIPVFFRVRVAE